MSNPYLDAYEAAVLRHWGELLARHHRLLRRPPAHHRIVVRAELDDEAEGEGDQRPVIPSLPRDI